jgi:hypothetical protein
MPLEPDDSHEMDMVAIFSSSNHDGEMEATAVHGVLEANNIPSILVGPGTIPVLEFQVRVPKEDLAAAERVLAEARAAGPAGAAEAEAAGEEEL